MSALKHPAPFSARPVYVCPTCGKHLPAGGWQREYDYADHLESHVFWASVRADLREWATLPLLALWGLWVALTGPQRHRHTGALAALLFALCAVVAILCSPWGK